MISDYLNVKERFDLMKAGALAYAGVLDATRGPLPEVKQAGALSAAKDGVDALKSLALLVSLGAGIPIGVFGHVMGRRIAGKRLREEELREKIKLYRTATDELANGLSEEAVV